ncbi:MAG: hypothetical protein WD009_13635 [Phycisphaeraceae bacterium]
MTEFIIMASLAQSGGRVDVAMQIGAGALAVALIWGGVSLYLRRNRVRGFEAFRQQPGFEPVAGAEDLERLAEDVADVFGDLAMYARQLHIAGALRYHARDDFDIEIAHVVLGMEASNAQHQSMEKIVVFVRGFDAALPSFRILPNNFMFRHIHRNKVFDAETKFGENNLVLGTDTALIRAVINDEVREALRDNRTRVIEARPDYLACFLHDERVEPADLERFVAECVALAGLLRDAAQAAGTTGTP